MSAGEDAARAALSAMEHDLDAVRSAFITILIVNDRPNHGDWENCASRFAAQAGFDAAGRLIERFDAGLASLAEKSDFEKVMGPARFKDFVEQST